MKYQAMVDFDQCNKGKCVNCTREQQIKCENELNENEPKQESTNANK